MVKDSNNHIFTILENILEEKEQAKHHQSLLESVLSKNNIYFLVLTKREEIAYHNIPDRSNLNLLSDCEYILGIEILNKSGNLWNFREVNLLK